jgi:3-oxoacyl-[acyl-carrier protein] reductase
MNLELKNKVCFVSGSSSGIGYAIGKKLLDEGAIVIFNSRSKIAIKKFNHIKNADFISADVSSLKDCSRISAYIHKKYKKIDLLICNVGSGSSLPPGKENHNEWIRMFNINFYSAVNLIETLGNKISNDGAILCISSICSLRVTGAPVTYSVAKSALNAYVKNIAPIFAKRDIRINALALGNILHNKSVWKKKLNSDPKKVLKYLKDNVSLQKFGTPEEVANFCAYILSPLASFATGSIYTFDGGQVL